MRKRGLLATDNRKDVQERDETAFDGFVNHDAVCLGFDFHLDLCFFTFSLTHNIKQFKHHINLTVNDPLLTIMIIYSSALVWKARGTLMKASGQYI